MELSLLCPVGATGTKGSAQRMSSPLDSDSTCLWVVRSHVIQAQSYVRVQKASIDDLELEGLCTRDAKLRLAMLEEITRILEAKYSLILSGMKVENRAPIIVNKSSVTKPDARKPSLETSTA
jgi:hypothetical protein